MAPLRTIKSRTEKLAKSQETRNQKNEELLKNINLTNIKQEIFVVTIPDEILQILSANPGAEIGTMELYSTQQELPSGEQQLGHFTTKPCLPENDYDEMRKKLGNGQCFLDSGGRVLGKRFLTSENGRESSQKKFNLVLKPLTQAMVFSNSSDPLIDDTRMEGYISRNLISRNVEGSSAVMQAALKVNPIKPKAKLTRMTRKEELEAEKRKLNMTQAIFKNTAHEQKEKEETKSKGGHRGPEWLEETKSFLFKFFEISPFYTGNQLAELMNENKLHLRPILREIANFHKSGTHAGKYEVKAEFMTIEQRKRKRTTQGDGNEDIDVEDMEEDENSQEHEEDEI